MARPQTIGTEIIKEHIRKNPKQPYRQMARILYKKYSQFWKDEEHCRSAIRYHVGSSGSSNKKSLADKSLIQPKRTQSYSLPKSDANERSTFHIPSGVRRLGIMSDVHLPYHDETAVIAAVDNLKENKIDALLLNGDMLDFYQLSTHEKDPRKRRFKGEVEIFKEFINWIKQELDCPIYYKIGNHEHRYERWMMHKAPELLDIDNFKLSEVLEYGKHGIIEIGQSTRIRAGKFTIYHGHEFKGSGGVNPARWLSLKSKISSAVGHFHKASEHVWRDSNDVTHACYSFGCLCDMSPDYLPENEWTQGFGILYLDKNGDYVMHNKKIINGKVY